MKTLLKNGSVVNLFSETIEKENILIEDGLIIGVGDYTDTDADTVEDISGKTVVPGLIDSHIHIESTMLTPKELAKVCLMHGTTAIVADPHEIANVCGTDGISYMLQASEGLPLNVYLTLPSCVPATPSDESGATLLAEDLLPFYEHKRVVGLAEMMNYPGVLAKDVMVMNKIKDAKEKGKIVDGHAPLLSGRSLDAYLAAGIGSDHECSMLDEALEKLKKGQHIMIRQGTAAKNLHGLLGLFEPPYCYRCLLATDDRHPSDLLREGHIDHIIRLAVKEGKSAIKAIRMATLQAAEYFGLRGRGAVAPGYTADLLVLDDLDSFTISDVYVAGVKQVSGNIVRDFSSGKIDKALLDKVYQSFHLKELSETDFCLDPKSKTCRVIQVIPGELLTEEKRMDIDWDKANGIDTARDILKLAVIERHHDTGHIGLGFISGIGLSRGAIASSVSHDSHNIIVIGTNENDMAVAANHIRTSGGNVVVLDGKILAEMPLPIAGLMADASAEEVAAQNEAVRDAVTFLGVNDNIEPFMNMAFVSLSVIPYLKMTTKGLIDVIKQEFVPLYT